MPAFPGNPGCWEQLQLLSLLAAAAQKQGSRVQWCSLSGLLFFPTILENSVGLCQLWAWCQLPPVCPWCFCLGTLCTQAPAESHTPDCKPVIPSDGFSHFPILLYPPWVPFSHFSSSSLISLSIACVLSFQSWATLCDPTVCSPPGSSAHGIFQARTLKWVAMPSFRGFSQPRNRTCTSYVPCVGRWIIYHWCLLRSPSFS